MRKGKRSTEESRQAGRETGKPQRGAAPLDPLSAAFRMLARRPYAIAEMRRALERKFPQDDRVPVAIARLRELGYLDDGRFAEQYAYSLAQNRAFGPHRLRRELKGKLVDHRYIEAAVKQAYQQASATELLQQALEKKLRAVRLPLTRTRFHALCQSLLRMGFNSGDIVKAVRARPELQPVAEDLETLDLEESEESKSF